MQMLLGKLSSPSFTVASSDLKYSLHAPNYECPTPKRRTTQLTLCKDTASTTDEKEERHVGGVCTVVEHRFYNFFF